jgi:hypothetical protein
MGLRNAFSEGLRWATDHLAGEKALNVVGGGVGKG